MGPILFSIFVNDLVDNMDYCTLVRYSDDTQFLHSGTVDELPEITLKNIKKYFFSNVLMLNSKKIQCIFIGNKQLLSNVPPNTIIEIDGEAISPSNHVKNLGMYYRRQKGQGHLDEPSAATSAYVTAVY